MLSNGTFSLHARRSLMTIKIILMDVRKAKAVQEYRVRHDIANVNELEAGKLLENLKASAIVMIWSLPWVIDGNRTLGCPFCARNQ